MGLQLQIGFLCDVIKSEADDFTYGYLFSVRMRLTGTVAEGYYLYEIRGKAG
jgi:hypothetical protein